MKYVHQLFGAALASVFLALLPAQADIGAPVLKQPTVDATNPAPIKFGVFPNLSLRAPPVQASPQPAALTSPKMPPQTLPGKAAK